MSFNSAHNPWSKLLNMPNQRPEKAIAVSVLVALICALGVSTSVVLLQPLQMANQQALRKEKMDSMLAALPALKEVIENTDVDSLDTRLVDLNSGDFYDGIDANFYDSDEAALDPTLSVVLDASDDVAKIGRRENYAQVHILRRDGKLELLVLPIYGKGYQSTIKAWLTLNGDLDTVIALTIFEQGETPGLGDRITEPDWQDLWQDKKLTDSSGDFALSVVKGKGSGPNEVDGISGATRTGNGINNMLEFWLSDLGFGLFLKKLQS